VLNDFYAVRQPILPTDLWIRSYDYLHLQMRSVKKTEKKEFTRVHGEVRA
jgi:hypothetical protein